MVKEFSSEYLNTSNVKAAQAVSYFNPPYICYPGYIVEGTSPNLVLDAQNL